MKVLASEFHPMRGHVEDGATIIFSDKTTAELKITMNGWALVGADGVCLCRPISCANELTRQILAIDDLRATA